MGSIVFSDPNGKAKLMTRITPISQSPELRIAVFGFLAAFVWEMWQMPFYESEGLDYVRVVRGCTLASIGDAGIMVFAYWIASTFGKNRFWLHSPTVKSVAIYLAAGEVITIAVEHIALNVPFGWRYADTMPIVPVIGIGLLPFAMWIIVPCATLALARWAYHERQQP